jgi:hypothetical protein
MCDSAGQADALARINLVAQATVRDSVTLSE